MVYFLKNGQNREFRALALPFELIAINEVLSFDSVYYKNLFKLMSKLLIDLLYFLDQLILNICIKCSIFLRMRAVSR